MDRRQPEENEGRYLIQIADWDLGLHVAVAPEGLPEDQKLHGSLLYSRSLDITGLIVSPQQHADKSSRLSLIPLGAAVNFGQGGLQELGQLTEVGDSPSGRQLKGTLILPEDALQSSVAALASAWRYIHLWIEGDPARGRAAVTGYAFSRSAPQ